MAFDYTALANDAKEIVDNFGRSITFVKFDQTPADANKPWRGDLTPRETPSATSIVQGAFVHPSSAQELGLAITETDFAGRESQIVVVAPGATSVVDYTTYDEIIDGTTRWKIAHTEVLKPGSLVMVYFFFVER